MNTLVHPRTYSFQIVFASSVQSGFLPPKRATMDRNRSRTDPHIAGTEPDHLGPVYFGPWDQFKLIQTGFFGKIHCTNINHLTCNYLSFHQFVRDLIKIWHIYD
ncbi:hypothetical protein K443DRAFT_102995 [Laccaria amethystina LaAM-08-1]|uniref:Uncharacterized protein n=1 Tax=Laccaria amethystina LaAM-08-1 TaxID=1095629 RepID=A0A0C9XT27_9AGAR|nr:hypothetical protein K443DRAFT_102995 [Laccaria amethystina LaAM-08-1]